MTNRVEAGGVEILDEATAPHEPVFPPKALFLALGAVLGLGLGSLLALIVDVRDHRIRSLVDLERAISGFGLPVLGQLPLLPQDARLGVGNIRAQHRQRDLHAFLFPQSLMAERCRGIRTALSFNEGGMPTAWTGFSVKWYGALMANHDILSAARVTVTINSAVGLESLMHRVPVVLCGPADFHHSAVTVRDAFDLDAGLSRARLWPWHYAAYLYWFLKLNCVNAGAPDMIDDVIARIAATGYDTSRLLPGGAAA